MSSGHPFIMIEPTVDYAEYEGKTGKTENAKTVECSCNIEKVFHNNLTVTTAKCLNLTKTNACGWLMLEAAPPFSIRDEFCCWPAVDFLALTDFLWVSICLNSTQLNCWCFKSLVHFMMLVCQLEGEWVSEDGWRWSVITEVRHTDGHTINRTM